MYIARYNDNSLVHMWWFLRLLPVKDLLYLYRTIATILSEKLSYRERTQLYWDKAPYSSERTLSVPGNPSKGDIKIYRDYTQNPRGAKVLLLGSTPALRQMLHDSGIAKYVVVDFSRIAAEKSRSLTNSIDPENEILLIANWFSMPLEQKSFDVIIGDLITSQILPQEQEEFMDKMARLLKNDGRFILRVHILDENIAAIPPQTIIKEFLSSTPFESESGAKLQLLYKLRDRLRNKTTQTTSPAAITHEIISYKTVDKQEANFLRSVAKTMSLRAKSNLEFITQTKAEFEAKIREYFEVENIQHASDYTYSNLFPIFLLKKVTRGFSNQ